MKKEPKRYECYECGFKSKKCKVLRLPGVGFAVCFKCQGRVKETEEWTAWHQEEMETWRKSIIARNMPQAIGTNESA